MSNKIQIIDDSAEQPIIEWSNQHITGKANDVKVANLGSGLNVPSKKDKKFQRRGSAGSMAISGTLLNLEDEGP